MKRFTFFVLIFLFLIQFNPVSSQHLPQVTLSDSAKVSLLTCSQGEELYSIFGHSAIRVTDPLIGIDWVFNYGTFDFSDPNFYPNFVKGKLNYILSVSTFENFEFSYILEDRFIYEQDLNLQQFEKQKLLDSLRVNYFPENRYYLYDFLYDNCATRIRDIFIETIPRQVDFDYSTLGKSKSFRELLMPNVKEKPWAKLGINLLLGVKADKKAAHWEYMFLPDHMLIAFQNAYFSSEEGLIPFAQEPKMILEGKVISTNQFRNSPFIVFMLVLFSAILITFFNIKWQRIKWQRINWFYDRMLFGVTGILGIVLFFQWFGSDHIVMSNNFNIIWANPFHLIISFLISINAFKKFIKYYFGVNMILMLLLLVLWFVIPQSLPLPMIPFVGALALRSAVIYKLNR
jgi:hypothetical protein